MRDSAPAVDLSLSTARNLLQVSTHSNFYYRIFTPTYHTFFLIMKVKVSQTFKYTLLYILSKPNARTFSDINFTCLFQIAKTKFSQ